jgi:formylmethanofuran dehydrogenase subunit E
MVPLLALLFSACVAPPRPSSDAAEWYYFDWLADAPQAPRFRVLDTESSLGPYAERDKTITLKDLVKMHGHACDGLVTAACAMNVGLSALYPGGVVDRTDTGCITKNSPCYGDVGSYLTGARIRFGTQKIDPALGNDFVLYRFSTGQAVKVSLRDGVFPAELASLETRIRSGDFTDGEMRACQQLAWDYARDLVERPLDESFELTLLPGMDWVPDEYEHIGRRGDVVNKGR